MQDEVINVPRGIEPNELRGELEKRIKSFQGYPIDVRKYRPSEKLKGFLDRTTWAHGRTEDMIVNPIHFTNTKIYPLYYGVARMSFYNIPLPQPGLVVTMTNDLNSFREYHEFGSSFSHYSAKIVFDGFDEYSVFFQFFKRNLLSINNHFKKRFFLTI